jgi:PadR family transcriptional regulator, regulatory protein PadR
MPIIRDFFTGFIKIHILHHANIAPVFGVELMEELKRHGYKVSPGLIYPILHSLESEGYLKRESKVIGGKVRKYYTITPKGHEMLENAKMKIKELVEEVIC